MKNLLVKKKTQIFLSCKIRRIVCYMLIIPLIVFISGCSNKNSSIIKEQTNQLVIYAGPYEDSILQAALKVFKEEYPNVKIEYKEFGNFTDPDANKNYLETLRTDLSSGSGPDLVLSENFNMSDIYSVIDSGTLLDLNVLLENDESFDESLYNEVVFDAGIYKGHRYYIPISYNVLTLTTTEKALKYADVTIDNSTNYKDMIEQFMNFMNKYANSSDELLFNQQCLEISAFFPWNGVEAINYETGEILTSNNEFKNAMEVYKAYYPLDGHIDDGETMQIESTTGDRVKALRNNRVLFYYDYLCVSNVLETYSALLEDQTPVIRSFPSYNDKVIAQPEYIAAIRSGSPNQANAYKFLKILLSEEFQEKYGMYSYADNVFMNVPILKSAVKNGIQNWANKYVGSGTEDGSINFMPLSDVDVQTIVDVYNNVDICRMSNYKVAEFIWTEMEPYFKDEKSYDECMKRLNNKLELYINE